MRRRQRFWLLALIPIAASIVGFGGDFLLHDYDPTRVIYKRLKAADRYLYEEIHPRFLKIDPADNMHVRSVTDAVRIREALADTIWGEHQPADETRFLRIGEMLGPKKGAARLVERLRISMDYDTHSTAWLYHSTNPNGRLIIYHHGFGSPLADNQWFIDRLLEEGYAVIAINLMGNGGNSAWASLPGGGSAHIHADLDKIDRPLRLHLDPAVAAIDLATGALGYGSVDMIGFSAGAFVTTVAAAVDPRIRRSYPIAGVYPIYLREGQDIFEKGIAYYPPMLAAASYVDMFALGTQGSTPRRQVQIFNRFDRCCFRNTKGQLYEQTVRDAARKLGDGVFEVVIDETHADHKISRFALDLIVKDLKRPLKSAP